MKPHPSVQYSEKPLKDMTKEVLMPLSAINHTIKTSTPTRTYLNEDKTNPVIILTEQAYKYLLSKCTEDEAWDLGWLGQSEEHAVSRPMHPKLKKHINDTKLRKLQLSATHRAVNTYYAKINDIWHYLNTTSLCWEKSVIKESNLIKGSFQRISR